MGVPFINYWGGIPLTMPGVESPLYKKAFPQMSREDQQLVTHYHNEGWIVIDLENIDFEKMIFSIDNADETYIKKQEGGYHYSDSPRLFEAWRWNQHVLDLARHPEVIRVLRLLYGREPKPFQTINFKKGSNQPLHSDVIHFDTFPPLWMAGVWTALEDMDPANGTLQYVPGSHKLPCLNFQSMSLPKAEYGKQFESYKRYEEIIKDIVETNNLPVKSFYAKPGQALVWSANLIHAGAPIVDQSRTRWSQATHYYFEGCDHYFSPMLSCQSKGDYCEKDLSTKDIGNHIIG